LFNLSYLLNSFTESDEGDDILFSNFNNNDTCVVVGTKTGFRVYKVFEFTPFSEVTCGGCQFVCQLFSTSLFALVGRGDTSENSPRKLRLYNTKTKSVKCELNFQDAVLNVKMTRQRMIVVLPDRIHIFDVGNNMQMLHCLDTPQNMKGICDFNFFKGQHLLAFPTSTNAGKVMVFDVFNLRVRSGITAHESPAQCLKFNPNGTLLATASTRGTVIRISNVETGELLYQFRRGISTSTIVSMSFSRTEKILAASSENNTAHLFSYECKQPKTNNILDSGQPRQHRKKKRKASMKELISDTITGSLPTVVKETFQPEGAFERIKVVAPGGRTGEILCTGFHPNGEFLICTRSGVLFRYNILDQKNVQIVDEQSLRTVVNEVLDAKYFNPEEKQNEDSAQN